MKRAARWITRRPVWKFSFFADPPGSVVAARGAAGGFAGTRPAVVTGTTGGITPTVLTRATVATAFAGRVGLRRRCVQGEGGGGQGTGQNGTNHEILDHPIKTPKQTEQFETKTKVSRSFYFNQTLS
ncbi:hypothetical protein [Crateriforma conspicua]|uniref:hypothetical protein n=1 Tax=Crateriforma conspicua TaxID=2527996 RepID=UPI0011B54F77|nr:hypothetical protein [Crateriforma conspicua]